MDVTYSSEDKEDTSLEASSDDSIPVKPVIHSYSGELLWLKIMVFLDFLSVALVVPLLSSYFRDVGVDSKLYAYISSSYQISQLLGGVVIGAMSDSLSKGTILLFSFIGSAISYLMVGLAKSPMLLFGSRVVVGLVKQTMSVSTSKIVEITAGDSAARDRELSQNTAIMTFSFVVGPTLGSLLYKYDPRLPCVIAAALFSINVFLCLTFMMGPVHDNDKKRKAKKKQQVVSKSIYDRFSSLVGSVQTFGVQLIELCSTKEIAYIVIFRILLDFINNAMSTRHILNYYESRFGIETSSLGFVSSLTACINIMTDLFVLPLINSMSIEPIHIISTCALLLSLTSMLEYISPTFVVYIATSMIPSVIIYCILAANIRSAFFDVIPTRDTGKAQGIMSIFSSLSGIAAPIYGAYLNTSNLVLGVPAALYLSFDSIVKAVYGHHLVDYVKVMQNYEEMPMDSSPIINLPLSRVHFATLHFFVLGVLIMLTRTFAMHSSSPKKKKMD